MSSLNTRSLRFSGLPCRGPFRAAPALLVAAAALAASPAEAALCNTLPKPVFVTGSGKVTIADLGGALTMSGITLIYKLQGSCLAVDAIVNGTPLGTTTASYWDANGMEQQCTLMNDIADVGLSDVFASTCQSLPNGLPTNVQDFFGPVEAYTFVVPKMSKQKSISKKAGYFIFGFGSESGVAPWTDESSIIIRDPTSGTQQMLAAAISVPAAKWKGVQAASSGEVVTKVSGSMNPEGTIGILTTEVAESPMNRALVSLLAYQDDGQGCGYWPDSTATATDKQNVRDGHYPLWGPLHLLTKLDAMGYPINPAAADLIGYLTGTKAPPNNLDLIALLAAANIIPGCAMQVQRTSELGPLASFAPLQACGCYFNTLTSSTKAKDCVACTSDAQCAAPAPHCSYGYCEAQ